VTGPELRAIRKRLGLTLWQMGQAIGYGGKRRNIANQIRQFEAGVRPVPVPVGRLVYMFDKHGVPPHFVS
jgi:hypothetical protein